MPGWRAVKPRGERMIVLQRLPPVEPMFEVSKLSPATTMYM